MKQTFDVAITEGKKILYYLRWVSNFGFIQISKEVYEGSNIQ